MTTGTHIRHLADLFLAHGVESRVTLRLAEPAPAVIRIWPYAVSQNLARKNEPPAGASGRGPADAPRDHHRTHVLVVPSTIDAYDQARRVVFENPVWAQGEARIRVMMEPLPLADLTSLFLASRVECCLALALVIDDV